MAFTLRPYQKNAVKAIISHFQKSLDPAVIVLPTGAGKSLVIAELARLAKGRVLVLAHVKELVEQNHKKYESYELTAGIYAAGLGRKECDRKVIFGSIQSVARANKEFFENFSLLIVDECHRISQDEDSQYLTVVETLRSKNKRLCITGLTATPYRLGIGWIYEYHHKGMIRSTEPRFFKQCVFELPLSEMIKQKYLSRPVVIDAPVACYDFSALTKKTNQTHFSAEEMASIVKQQKRVTPGVVAHIFETASDRQGVMIFTASIAHAKEVLDLLPKEQSCLVTGNMKISERNHAIDNFKAKRLKFLVNVSVLTTGFDAPHVDLIALLRPTESVSLFQQIVGRGLRLSPGKKDCLVLDYTGMRHDLFEPQIDQAKPNSESQIVEVSCPICDFSNQFWGIKDGAGNLVEHYGRRCCGASLNTSTQKIERCSYRFRFKVCESCGEENDIAARTCHKCQSIIIDDDTRLKKAMALKDAHVMRPDTMLFDISADRKKAERLSVSYYDLDGQALKEHFYLSNPSGQAAFYYKFSRMHLKVPESNIRINSAKDAVEKQHLFRMPRFVIARKKKHYWSITEKIF